MIAKLSAVFITDEKSLTIKGILPSVITVDDGKFYLLKGNLKLLLAQ
jgi:hypothetical protein